MRRPNRVRKWGAFVVGLGMLLMLAGCFTPADPTLTPAPTLVPSLTATEPDIQAAVEATLTALAPTQASAIATPAVTPTITETPLVITLPPLTGNAVEPPLDITLPEGWQVVGYDAQVLQDVSQALLAIPVAVYSGPINGGRGIIVLYWGFPNIVDPLPESGTPVALDLWSDGLRLLRLAVVEQGCNVGTDLKRTYRVGLLSGVGTQWAAVGCPELPDTRGWFVGVEEKGLNFVFYAYGDPITALDTGSGDLQAILDTVRFRVPVVTPAPTVTPG